MRDALKRTRFGVPREHLRYPWGTYASGWCVGLCV